MSGEVFFFYRTYGLKLRSEIELPELSPEAGDAFDIDIRLRPIEFPAAAQSEDPTTFTFAPERQLLHWRSAGSFLISGARQIDIDPIEGVGKDVLRLPLLGPVMALLLHQRGNLVLHASAVVVGTQSAVFLGDKQAGKSTTAAALLGRGHRLLADDVVAIDFPPAGPRVLPAFPDIKLDPGPAEELMRRIAVESSTAVPGAAKRRLHIPAAFSNRETPPGRIYVLATASAARVTALSPHDAVGALLRFAYIWRFGRGAIDAGAAAIHLKQCAALVGQSRVCRLDVPRDLDRLGEALDLVEGELA